MKVKIESQEVVSRQLMIDFGKVLSVSIRAFDGTRIVELLWKINTKLG